VTREALTVHIEPGSTPAAGWVVLTNRGTADPASVVLTPGDGFQISFNLLDGTWRLDAFGRPLPPQVEIAAVYEVPPSSEAVAHQVWTGLVSSEQVTIPLGTRVR
jgi:hypothetical protein